MNARDSPYLLYNCALCRIDEAAIPTPKGGITTTQLWATDLPLHFPSRQP